MAVSIEEMLVEIMIKLDRIYTKVEKIESKVEAGSKNISGDISDNMLELKTFDVENIKKEVERKRKEAMDGIKMRQLYNRGTKK
jgi:hypothetical protein